MRTLLLYPDRDFSFEDDQSPCALSRVGDLSISELENAMAGDDAFVLGIVQKVLRTREAIDKTTILHRQDVLRDCLKNATHVRELYAIASEAFTAKRKYQFRVLSWYPAGVLHDAKELMKVFIVLLKRLKDFADKHGARFDSLGFSLMMSMLRSEFPDSYFETIEGHLERLEFKSGMLLSASPGEGNVTSSFVLRQFPEHAPNWFQRHVLGQGAPEYSFSIGENDESGARFLSELRDRGINIVANVLAQAADHVLGFFDTLRTETAFFVGCINLHERLERLGVPTCMPEVAPLGSYSLSFDDLCDASLALSMNRPVVANSLDATGRHLIVISGANQGGKTSFLRAIGIAQFLMQHGVFVPAKRFVSDETSGLFTHFRHEEDATMTSGKFDEELVRLDDLVDQVKPGAMILFNESFASTNEREGSEIARQVVTALLERNMRVLFVTHMYDFAHSLAEKARPDYLFLLAERTEDGTRTFRLRPGDPVETSFGEDLYRQVFQTAEETA